MVRPGAFEFLSARERRVLLAAAVDTMLGTPNIRAKRMRGVTGYALSDVESLMKSLWMKHGKLVLLGTEGDERIYRLYDSQSGATPADVARHLIDILESERE